MCHALLRALALVEKELSLQIAPLKHMTQLSAEQRSVAVLLQACWKLLWDLQQNLKSTGTVRLDRLCVCVGPDQASLIKDLMAYFVSDAVQQNLHSWTLMPLPKALATAAQQAVAGMITLPSNQTRGGQAATTSAPPGDKPCDAM